MLNTPRTTFINYAHRGASTDAPENTMAAFQKAVEIGATGIELDLQKTKDNQIVIFHDDYIDQKSNGTGKIADYTYAELLKLDFGSWFNPKFKGEKIVLFADFMRWAADKDLTLAIELKAANVEKETYEIVKKYLHTNNFYFTSFMYDALARMRKLDNSLKLGWLIEEDINSGNLEKLKVIAGNQICPPAKLVTPAGIKLARARGISVRLWGVANPEIMEQVFNLDTDGMTVNFPGKLKALMERSQKWNCM